MNPFGFIHSFLKMILVNVLTFIIILVEKTSTTDQCVLYFKNPSTQQFLQVELEVAQTLKEQISKITEEIEDLQDKLVEAVLQEEKDKLQTEIDKRKALVIVLATQDSKDNILRGLKT